MHFSKKSRLEVLFYIQCLAWDNTLIEPPLKNKQIFPDRDECRNNNLLMPLSVLNKEKKKWKTHGFNSLISSEGLILGKI